MIVLPTNEAQLALTLLRDSCDAICVTDAAGRILLVNEAFTRITGYAQAEVCGQSPRILKSGEQGSEFYAGMWRSLLENGRWQGEIINRHKDGSLYSEWLRIGVVADPRGQPAYYVGQFGYIAEQRQLVEHIARLSRFDPLTGLPNRSQFNEHLEQALAAARRHQLNTLVVLVNIDRFRFINDTLGQAAGDQVLVTMAQRFGALVREGDSVARLSGNEFGLLVCGLASVEDGIPLAKRLQEAIAQPLELGDRTLVLAGSIGVSVAPRDGDAPEALLQAADVALIRAKEGGGNGSHFYSPHMNAEAQRRQQLEAGLRRALAQGELSLVYQPQNGLSDGSVLGAEALLRWQSAELGVVSPAEFIPVAEASGQIAAIGHWVLREACAQARSWLDQGLPRLRVAVNVSAHQFRNAAFPAEVAAVLDETGLPAELLELELTESALVSDLEAAIATCHQLKALGLHLALDDFGTGYSSLAYIARFPFDKLKIDKSFVDDITHNPANAAIATAAIAIARGLNLASLAEGVETEAQALFLRGRHCNVIQGYLFSKPLPPLAFAQLLYAGSRLQLGAQHAPGDQALLVLDDEPAVGHAMRRLFRHEAFRTLTATSCQEAFELLAQEPVQVIISDQRMPGMSGTDFFARVRKLYPHTRRIILSSHSELDIVMDAVNRGAVYKILSKPWDDDALRELVREAFRHETQSGGGR